ncbi:expressed unknown protein [Seminavis robusta]|uniref:CRAL-TRIO domain-containing protein n=1 Tax=Seminavis robusta TaxID=568900 RepID=A0A9N8HHX2_9STRA|nr:expressed unknown protein [Seminavis robusta]|eukprot:Sro560_g166630.1 n/a (288) ;mRNA; r:11501-12608
MNDIAGAQARMDEEVDAPRNGDPAGEDKNSMPGMSITEAERAWALTIKEAVEANDEIDNLSDFWYAQLAIVDHDNVDAAQQHSAHMQAFRQEYDIRDNLEDAKSTVWEFLTLFDRPWVLAFSYSVESQSYIWVVDIAQIDKKDLVTNKQWRIYLAGLYYLRQALNPNLRAISTGISIIHECEGFDFGKMGGLEHVARMARELIGEYPARHYSLRFFHTGYFVNVMMSTIKRFLPKNMTERMEYGCSCDGRLDQIWLVPDAKTVLQRNYIRIMQTLQLRYENEARFSL